MDLSSYTPIYVRTTGSDANDGLTVGSPKLTAQAAYDTALAHGGGEGDKVIDFGAGDFAPGITLAADWPVRIAVRGAGVTSSFLGGVLGVGVDEGDSGEPDHNHVPAGPGFNINIVGNNTVNLGSISTKGGDCRQGDAANAGSGGSITLTDSTSGDISAVGGVGGSTYSGGAGGSVSLTGSTSGAISASGGAGPGMDGGTGGSISLTDSTSGAISTQGGNAGNTSGSGGSVTLVGSTSGTISSIGGGGYYGGSGGAVNLSTSIVTTIDTAGGSGATTGNGGGITSVSSSMTDISLLGGVYTGTQDEGGNGACGSFSITGGSVGNISAYGMTGYMLLSGISQGTTGGGSGALDSCLFTGSVFLAGGNGAGGNGDAGGGGNGGSVSVNNVVTDASQFSIAGGSVGVAWEGYTQGGAGASGTVTYTNCSFSAGHEPHPSRVLNATNVWTLPENTDNETALGCSVVLSGTGKNTGSVGGYLKLMSLTATNGVVVDAGGNGTVSGVTKDSTGATISLWEFSGANAARKISGNAIFKNGKTTLYSVTGTAAFTDKAGVVAAVNNAIGGNAVLPFADILGAGLL